jgi:hypothetical protein
MLKALRYEILRGITASCQISHPMKEVPVRVATLIDEENFLQDQIMTHNKNVFLEDRMHDWDHSVKNGVGQFRYYTRIAEAADVLVVYEVDSDFQLPPRFNPDTGEPLIPTRITAPFSELRPGPYRYVAPGGKDSSARPVEVVDGADGKGLRVRFISGLHPMALRDIHVEGVFLHDVV